MHRKSAIQYKCLALLNSIFTVALISGHKACFEFSSSKFENNWLCLYNYTEKIASKHSSFAVVSRVCGTKIFTLSIFFRDRQQERAKRPRIHPETQFKVRYCTFVQSGAFRLYFVAD